MNIELGIGIGKSSLFNTTSSDRLIAFAWASALAPSVSASTVVNKTINAVLANSGASALSPTVSSAGNAMVSSVTANADGNALAPSVAIAGSISINAIVASGNLDSMIPVVSTIRNVSVGGVIANGTASAGVPTISTTGVAPTVIVQDSFNRVNSTTSLGVADTGQTWQALAGVMGIQSNQAYVVNGAGQSVIESNYSDNIAIEVTVAVIDDFRPIYFRVKDVNNFFAITCVNTSSGYQLQKVVANTWTVLGTTGATVSTNDLVRVELVGSILKLYKNGIKQLEITDAFNQTETKHGMGNWDLSNGRWDDFVVKTL